MSFKKNINDIKKNYSLGIIGGGQLGMMITEAAKKMPEHILKIIVFDINRFPIF